jgi:hypothetical protein
MKASPSCLAFCGVRAHVLTPTPVVALPAGITEKLTFAPSPGVLHDSARGMYGPQTGTVKKIISLKGVSGDF